MEYPSKRVMVSLKALVEGIEMATDDDTEALIRLPSAKFEPVRVVPFPLEDQEELLDRGWVELVGEDRIEVTEAGRYYLAKYLKDHKRGRVK